MQQVLNSCTVCSKYIKIIYFIYLFNDIGGTLTSLSYFMIIGLPIILIAISIAGCVYCCRQRNTKLHYVPVNVPPPTMYQTMSSQSNMYA